MEPERQLKRKEVAVLYGYSPWQVYELTRQGKIPHYKIGGTYYYPKSELDEWVKQNARNAVRVEI